ncbi:hypothetical protein AXX17_AT5G59190 [Arabidopsis thaliana]|uniref:Very-long-chain (3R)-3-hydroxyacyl-CoA dehydratase n=1 Tax=Arabidopsis thaliana TaxID=3702 RepID=A0A178UI18_ARATH|nr:hypothetical protein AXX17_AT5G59190 [Arabidopsis thaliana]
MSPFVKFYLFSYNFLQASAWAISLLIILNSFLSNKTIISAYASAGFLISLFQTAAVLEVLHGAIGIVPSGFLSPLMQWSGRTHFILAIVGQIKEVQDSPWLSITLVAWCIGEVSLIFTIIKQRNANDKFVTTELKHVSYLKRTFL